jgi:hypothetical protein
MARSSPSWRYRELDASHHAAVTDRDKVTDVLIELST